MAGLSPDDRALLLRTARSRQVPLGVATRARLVVDTADLGPAEAARRASVSPATAAKWQRRFHEAGLAGLRDAPRAGRPSTGDDVVRRVLGCALVEPPAGAARWTTRSVAAATGVSQATVSRIRRRHFPPAGEAVLHDRASVLTHVGADDTGCVLAFHAGTGSRGAASPARVDAVETVVCAALLRPAAPGSALPLLRRAAERLPTLRGATLLVDVELDAAARAWLQRHPELVVHAAPGAGWFGLTHRIADALDPRQLGELRQVQRLVRQARRDDAGSFAWTRTSGPAPAPRAVPGLEAEPLPDDVAHVVRGICAAITDGQLRAADPLALGTVARRSGLSAGRVADALAQLAAEALVDRRAGRYLVPTPTPRDIAETYTARGLLGTAITRRLAAERPALPAVVDEHLAGIVRCHELGLTPEACDLDLDLQDELARAAAMPRIGSMFVRLTLQLRLFVAIFGLSYRYPPGEIATDDRRILTAIRRHDPDAAAEAWRGKIDNCARYMLTRLGPLT